MQPYAACASRVTTIDEKMDAYAILFYMRDAFYETFMSFGTACLPNAIRATSTSQAAPASSSRSGKTAPPIYKFLNQLQNKIKPRSSTCFQNGRAANYLYAGITSERGKTELWIQYISKGNNELIFAGLGSLDFASLSGQKHCLRIMPLAVWGTKAPLQSQHPRFCCA